MWDYYFYLPFLLIISFIAFDVLLTICMSEVCIVLLRFLVIEFEASMILLVLLLVFLLYIL